MTMKGKNNADPIPEKTRRLAIEAIKRARLERESRGEFPAEFMRLSLTDDANEIVKGMSNAEFREFVSAAIRRAAKRRSPSIPLHV